MEYERKPLKVDAREYDGFLPLVVLNDAHGEQTAHYGDYLVGSKKGEIRVVSKVDFENDFIVPKTTLTPAQFASGANNTPIVAGDSVRVIDDNRNLDTTIRKAVSIGPEHIAVDNGRSYAFDRVVKVEPLQNSGQALSTAQVPVPVAVPQLSPVPVNAVPPVTPVAQVSPVNQGINQTNPSVSPANQATAPTVPQK